MKTNLIKLMAAGTVMALALTLAACGSAGETPEDALNKAQEAMNGVSSMHYTMDMDIGMSADGESYDITTTAEADCIIDPMTLGMDMHMSMASLLDLDMKMYMVQDGSSYTIYTGMDDGDGNITWTQETMDDLDALAQYNGQKSMEIYLENGTNFTEAGSEEINGVNATRYDGVITGDSIQAVMDASGVIDQFASLGLEGLEELYQDLGDIPVSIWLDPDTSLPVKYEMDMTAMMQGMMDKLMASEDETADLGLTIDKCAVVMVCSDYNGIDAIEIPQEALDASSADDLGNLLVDQEEEALEQAAEDAA